jgi:hypothetical protein
MNRLRKVLRKFGEANNRFIQNFNGSSTVSSNCSGNCSCNPVSTPVTIPPYRRVPWALQPAAPPRRKPNLSSEEDQQRIREAYRQLALRRMTEQAKQAAQQ